ncbi:MAG: hypothetical protein M4579_005218 [Chaenotheca gracillima]|nr:MAG: hypothetical protein M4579_005218 [Chaenotheca gracillima]
MDAPQSRNEHFTTCRRCTISLDWDILREYYRREEAANWTIVTLQNQVEDLTNSLHHTAVAVQNERLSSTQGIAHIRILETQLKEATTVIARLEAEAVEQRQEQNEAEVTAELEKQTYLEMSNQLDKIANTCNTIETALNGMILASRSEYATPPNSPIGAEQNHSRALSALDLGAAMNG